MKNLALATTNKNKFNELQKILRGVNLILPPVDLDVEENGKTFLENAIIKAQAVAKIMKITTISDDSGLMVEALHGAPGVHSARYEKTDEKRISKLINELKGKENRKASFVCAGVVLSAEGEILYKTEQYCEGIILEEPRGSNGFGYDPIFYLPRLKKTFAELSLEEKNTISHRAKTFEKIKLFLGKS